MERGMLRVRSCELSCPTPMLLDGTIALFRPRYPAFSWNVYRSADSETKTSSRQKVNLPWSKSRGLKCKNRADQD